MKENDLTKLTVDEMPPVTVSNETDYQDAIVDEYIRRARLLEEMIVNKSPTEEIIKTLESLLKWVSEGEKMKNISPDDIKNRIKHMIAEQKEQL